MSKEGDHHYVPQFHLRKWADGDGFLIRWGRVGHNGKLTAKRVAPAATAYVPGLYALQHVREERIHLIEKRVFGFIDDKAAPILDLLVRRGGAGLSSADRYWWALYLHASIARVPHVVKMITDRADEMVANVLSQPDPDFDAAKGAAPETSLLEWAQNHAPARLANSGLNVLVNMLGNERPIHRLLSFRWIVRNVESSNRPLMIGDDPLERIGDLYQPTCLINLPLTPGHAFFATNSEAIAQNISRKSDRQVVNAANISSVSTAKQFAYGDAESSFVDRYLLKQSAN